MFRPNMTFVVDWALVNHQQATVRGFLLASMVLGKRFGESFPAGRLFSIFFLLSGDYLAHTNSTLYARIGPQWFSELSRLWPNVP